MVFNHGKIIFPQVMYILDMLSKREKAEGSLASNKPVLNPKKEFLGLIVKPVLFGADWFLTELNLLDFIYVDIDLCFTCQVQ